MEYNYISYLFDQLTMQMFLMKDLIDNIANGNLTMKGRYRTKK